LRTVNAQFLILNSQFSIIKMRIYKILPLIVLYLTTFLETAQAQTDNVDFMHSIGKIYAVVAVIVLIFLGIIAFLIYLERRISRMENQIINKE